MSRIPHPMAAIPKETVRIAQIGERQHQSPDSSLMQARQNLGEGNVIGVRPFIVAPAYVQPDTIARNIDQRLVEGVDHKVDKAKKIRQRSVGKARVMLKRQAEFSSASPLNSFNESRFFRIKR